MANGKIIQLKELDDLSTPIYPVTKADAVYLQDGSLLTDYLRGSPQSTVGAENRSTYLNNGVLTARNEVYSKTEVNNLLSKIESFTFTPISGINIQRCVTKTCGKVHTLDLALTTSSAISATINGAKQIGTISGVTLPEGIDTLFVGDGQNFPITCTISSSGKVYLSNTFGNTIGADSWFWCKFVWIA